jgi:hypothetical protein
MAWLRECSKLLHHTQSIELTSELDDIARSDPVEHRAGGVQGGIVGSQDIAAIEASRFGQHLLGPRPGQLQRRAVSPGDDHHHEAPSGMMVQQTWPGLGVHMFAVVVADLGGFLRLKNGSPHDVLGDLTPLLLLYGL